VKNPQKSLARNGRPTAPRRRDGRRSPKPATVARQVERRRHFLEAEAERERLTLEAVRADHGEMVVVAELMIGLTITQLEVELRWLGKVEAKLVSRKP